MIPFRPDRCEGDCGAGEGEIQYGLTIAFYPVRKNPAGREAKGRRADAEKGSV
jgi:hypothetical protein